MSYCNSTSSAMPGMVSVLNSRYFSRCVCHCGLNEHFSVDYGGWAYLHALTYKPSTQEQALRAKVRHNVYLTTLWHFFFIFLSPQVPSNLSAMISSSLFSLSHPISKRLCLCVAFLLCLVPCTEKPPNWKSSGEMFSQLGLFRSVRPF